MVAGASGLERHVYFKSGESTPNLNIRNIVDWGHKPQFMEINIYKCSLRAHLFFTAMKLNTFAVTVDKALDQIRQSVATSTKRMFTHMQ